MAFDLEVAEYFPKVQQWRGCSEIHVSLSQQSYVVGSFSPAEVLKTVRSHKIAEVLYANLTDLLGNMEFLLDEEMFSKLMLVCVDWALKGKLFVTPDQIQNPVTGNYFHRIALMPPDFVGGIRFWAGLTEDSFSIGWRFRITRLDSEGEEKKVRNESERRRLVILENIEEVYDLIAEIAEPPVDAAQFEQLYVKAVAYAPSTGYNEIEDTEEDGEDESE